MPTKSKTAENEIFTVDLGEIIKNPETIEKLRVLCAKEGLPFPQGVATLMERFVNGETFSFSGKGGQPNVRA